MAHYIHYIILGVVIVYILYRQFNISRDTKAKLRNFSSTFPEDIAGTFGIVENSEKGTCITDKKKVDDINKLKLQYDEEEQKIYDLEKSAEPQPSLDEEKTKVKKLANKIKQKEENLYSSEACGNPLGKTIISAINSYLLKNRNSSADFQLIKDIVDRNCDATEDEINTQIPVPLYLGLAGTMCGIIIGIGTLCLMGGLTDLLNPTQHSGNGENGIQALIGGVALAMISSLVGVILTTSCSMKAKDAKKENERRKHDFLSWIQAELLPVLSSDAMSAISKMTENLTRFNATFAQNARELKNTLTVVGDTTKDQKKLFEALEKLKIQKIATANIEVYNKLRNCTDEIGCLAENLKASRQYLEKVSELTSKLDASDQRISLIEEMAKYFIDERSNMDAIKGVIAKSMGDADKLLQNASKKLQENVTNEYNELINHFTQQRKRFNEVADEQQKALERRMDELSTLTTEITNLKAVKTSLDALVKSTDAHNHELDALANAIKELALVKVSGNAPVGMPLIPKKLKIIAIVGGSIILLYCLAQISSMVYYIFIR